MFFFRTRRKWIDGIVLPCDEIKFVSRYEWGSKEPWDRDPLRPPVHHVLLKLDSDTPECRNFRECRRILRELQRMQMKDYKYVDIECNFMISSDGTVYEGRGWDITPEKPPPAYVLYNECSLSIGYIGDFKDREPPPEMEKAFQNLINYGVNEQIIKYRPNIVKVREVV